MSLKQKTIKGIIWVLINQFSKQGITFIISLVLARLLLPKDFGLIGMITIVIAVGQTLIDSGLTSSLMRKVEPDSVDYSTVFYTNLLGSTLIYAVVYFSAPYIAAFYKQDLLTNLIRVLSLSFIISAFSSVQNTILTKELKFKALLMISLPSVILGGVVGIVMAFNNYGVWSLVGMQLTSSVISSIQLWIRSRWMPGFIFSFTRLKEHYRFGINLAMSSILDTVFANSYHIIIGRFFSPAQLGFYTRAMTLKQLPVANISSALNKVTYPVFASIQNDDVKLKEAYRKVMQQVMLWITPVLIGMAVLAEPLFILLFTEKWLPAVPYFQILCVEGIMYPLCAYNLNILKVKGRSDLYLRLEVIKKVFVVVGIIIAIPFGIYGLLYMQVLFSVFGYFLNSYYSGKFLKYTVLHQIKDILPTILAALSMGFVCYLALQLLHDFSVWIKVIVPTIIGFIWYYTLCNLLKFDSMINFNQIIFKRVRQRI